MRIVADNRARAVCQAGCNVKERWERDERVGAGCDEEAIDRTQYRLRKQAAELGFQLIPYRTVMFLGESAPEELFSSCRDRQKVEAKLSCLFAKAHFGSLVGSPQDRRWTVQLFERFGSYYNGRLNEFRVRASSRANERLSFSVGPQWNRFRLPLDGNFSVVFGALETDYAFSRFLSFSTILQINTANAQAASANTRWRWNYRPDSDLYVIYTAGQKFTSLAAANPAQFYENRFVVKYTYSFRP